VRNTNEIAYILNSHSNKTSEIYSQIMALITSKINV